MNSSVDKSSKIKLSVCVITYNQEKYIRQCLQSILDQEVDFDYEVIIGDDCSTDGTREIVREFADKYPGIVRAIFQDVNTGGSKNNLDVHAAASGEYIAHIDGDDYALPGKLQTQVNFLDEHQNCNISWHRMLILDEVEGTLTEDLIDLNKFPKTEFTRNDVLHFVTIGLHSSKMYRSSVKDIQIPDFPVTDFFINVEQLESGVACFCSDKPLGVYRIGTGTGIAINGTAIQALNKSFMYFCHKYPESRLSINTAALLLFLIHLKNKRPSAKNFFKVWIKTFHFLSPLNLARNRNIIGMLRLKKK